MYIEIHAACPHLLCLGPSHPLQPPPPYLVRAQRRRSTRSSRGLVFPRWGASYPRPHGAEPAPLRSLLGILIASFIGHGQQKKAAVCCFAWKVSKSKGKVVATTNRLRLQVVLWMLSAIPSVGVGKQCACVLAWPTASPPNRREQGVQMSSDSSLIAPHVASPSTLMLFPQQLPTLHSQHTAEYTPPPACRPWRCCSESTAAGSRQP